MPNGKYRGWEEAGAKRDETRSVSHINAQRCTAEYNTPGRLVSCRYDPLRILKATQSISLIRPIAPNKTLFTGA